MDNLYIMAAGESSRFGSPKILKTFPLNEVLIKKYFNPIIVTTKELYNYIGKLNSDFIIGDFGNGIIQDIKKLQNIVKNNYYIAWSDVLFQEEELIEIKNNFNKNFMLIHERDNPYISLKIKDKIIGYTKRKNKGYQDNSIFFLNNLVFDNCNEFMDLVKYNSFNYKIINTKSLYFNTEKEFQEIEKNH